MSQCTCVLFKEGHEVSIRYDPVADGRLMNVVVMRVACIVLHQQASKRVEMNQHDLMIDYDGIGEPGPELWSCHGLRRP